MKDLSTTLGSLHDTLSDAFQSFVAYLPWLGAALLLLLIGWQVARLMRSACAGLGAAVNSLLLRFSRSGQAAQRPRLSSPIVALIGNIVFWLVILLFLTLAARVAQLDLFTTWLYQIVSYLPTLLAGGLIVLAGFLISTLARDVVATALESSGSQQGNFFGLLAQSAIFLAALVIGLDQIGVNVTFLTLLFAIVVGGLLLGIALAFGFGARVFVSNIIGAHQIRDQLIAGQHTRIGDFEGEIIEFTATAVVLATDSGRLTVPAKLFQEQATQVFTADRNE